MFPIDFITLFFEIEHTAQNSIIIKGLKPVREFRFFFKQTFLLINAFKV